jgi:hypothetical protein
MFASPLGFEVKALVAGTLIDRLAGHLGALETDGLAPMGMLLVPGDIIMSTLMTVEAGRRWHCFHPAAFIE